MGSSASTPKAGEDAKEVEFGEEEEIGQHHAIGVVLVSDASTPTIAATMILAQLHADDAVKWTHWWTPPNCTRTTTFVRAYNRENVKLVTEPETRTTMAEHYTDCLVDEQLLALANTAPQFDVGPPLDTTPCPTGSALETCINECLESTATCIVLFLCDPSQVSEAPSIPIDIASNDRVKMIFAAPTQCLPPTINLNAFITDSHKYNTNTYILANAIRYKLSDVNTKNVSTALYCADMATIMAIMLITEPTAFTFNLHPVTQSEHETLQTQAAPLLAHITQAYWTATPTHAGTIANTALLTLRDFE